MPEYILDTCVDVDPQNKNYPAYFFQDLLKNRRIKVVIGGSKASTEVSRKAKLRELLNILSDRGQVTKRPDDKVDLEEERIRTRIFDVIGATPEECDDLHIFALASVSGCLLVISRDNRMAICRNCIRNKIGHAFCPDIVVIQNEDSYNRTK